jgi:hypothetical protein
MTDETAATLWIRTGPVGLPVLIRDSTLTKVAGGLGNRAVKVPPGHYLVRVMLPGNRVIEQSVTALAGRSYPLDLFPELGEAVESARPIPVRHGPVRLVSAHRGALPAGWQLELMRQQREIFTAAGPARVLGIETQHGARQAYLRTPRDDGLFFLRVSVDDAVIATVALPAVHGRCVFVSDDDHAVAAYPGDPLAQRAMEYLAFADLAEGAQMFTAELFARILDQRSRDPFPAVAGAYLLLRSGNLDTLADWPQRIGRLFRWLPDGPVVAGEMAALAGRHADAAQAFVEAAGRGVPILTAGFAVLASRLRQYARPGAARQELSVTQRAAVDELEAVYGRWAPAMDYGAPTTTFAGPVPVG